MTLRFSEDLSRFHNPLTIVSKKEGDLGGVGVYGM